MNTLKKNVSVFNSNVADNGGYLYTTNAPLSSVLANKRITDATLAVIDDTVQTVVDIGTGDGAYANDILQQKPHLKITGFDPAAEAIKSATEKYPRIAFLTGDILDVSTLPSSCRDFDIGIIRGVLHHLVNPQLAITNAMILSNSLLIIEPNGNNPILKVIEKLSPYHRQHEERSFSSRTLKKWCKAAGYNVEQLNFVGFVPFFFPTFLTKVIYFFQPFLEKIYPLKKYFGAQTVLLCRKKQSSNE
jgi:2-polyprenyl-3-methyl-5-hydroxy-6-metoxy-1,4-benzoquinol methylase